MEALIELYLREDPSWTAEELRRALGMEASPSEIVTRPTGSRELAQPVYRERPERLRAAA